MIDFSDVRFAKKALEFFLEISKIPRGSGNTGPIADHLEGFAYKRGVYCKRDANNSVIIKKPASLGFESHDPVILQGHTDIVAEKTKDATIDMEKEGLNVYRDGDFLRAKDTTLGADNGVALAYMLAILDDKDISHPEIEAVFTSDEETGLTGAEGLDTSELRGRRMINLDSDEEGAFVVGCAGGLRITVTLRSARTVSVPRGYRLTVAGLLGGHSGTDINLCRANAVKLAARILGAEKNILLTSLVGGNKDNAIPREAVAEFSADDIEKAQAEADKIIEEYKDTVEKPIISFEEIELDMPSFDKKTSRDILDLICEIPFGVIKMSGDIEGLVETSINLGIMKTLSSGFEVHYSLRSSKESEKASLAERVHTLALKYGAEFADGDAYPGWAYKKDSELRQTMVEVYKKMTGKEPRVFAIHAGLECGILMDKIEGLDCISMGPDNFAYHTTEEHLSISSFDRVYAYLLEVLKNL